MEEEQSRAEQRSEVRGGVARQVAGGELETKQAIGWSRNE
jgi:hypothetical protein